MPGIHPGILCFNNWTGPKDLLLLHATEFKGHYSLIMKLTEFNCFVLTWEFSTYGRALIGITKIIIQHQEAWPCSTRESSNNLDIHQSETSELLLSTELCWAPFVLVLASTSEVQAQERAIEVGFVRFACDLMTTVLTSAAYFHSWCLVLNGKILSVSPSPQ